MNMATKGKVTQREIRQGVDVGSGLMAVSPVAYWYKAGHFETEEAARGAFELAYQQGMDGMGKSVEEWMGLSDTEYTAWRQDGSLPKRK
jgi:hypothetical protein